jgi:hypothetical protein
MKIASKVGVPSKFYFILLYAIELSNETDVRVFASNAGYYPVERRGRVRCGRFGLELCRKRRR